MRVLPKSVQADCRCGNFSEETVLNLLEQVASGKIAVKTSTGRVYDDSYCSEQTCGYGTTTHHITEKCRPCREGVGAPSCPTHACPTCKPLPAFWKAIDYVVKRLQREADENDRTGQEDVAVAFRAFASELVAKWLTPR